MKQSIEDGLEDTKNQDLDQAAHSSSVPLLLHLGMDYLWKEERYRRRDLILVLPFSLQSYCLLPIILDLFTK
ncbi:hypothetical protein P3S68_024116 [Capsicum galapagoense]